MPRVASESCLVFPTLTVPIAPVTVVAFGMIVTVVAISAIVVVLAVVVVSICVAAPFVAVSMVVVVVAALLWTGVHGSHVVHSHLRPVAEALMPYRTC